VQVFFDSIALSGAAVTVGHHEIQAIIPSGVGTNHQVKAVVASLDSNTRAFSYDAPNPASISPDSAPTTGGTGITITGINFGPFGTPVSVSMDGLTFDNATVTVPNTEIQATLPAGAGINHTVTVSAGGQSGDCPQKFDFDAPVISGISPANGPTAGGTLITLSGNNFGPLDTPIILFINGAACSNAAVTVANTEIQAETPSGSGLDRAISLLVSGQAATTALNFDYDAPVITGISPRYAPSTGNTTATISGQNFGVSPVVRIGSVVCSIRAVADDSIEIDVPSGTGTLLPVQVISDGQQSNPFSGLTYTPDSEVLPVASGDPPVINYEAEGVTIDFGTGTASGNTTVTAFLGTNESISNLGQPSSSDLYWRIEADQAFESAHLVFHYDPALIEDSLESGLVLYSASSLNGPWTLVESQILDTNNDTICGDTTHFSYFVLAGSSTPVTLSSFHLE
jgi:hypothetical protein